MRANNTVPRKRTIPLIASHSIVLSLGILLGVVEFGKSDTSSVESISDASLNPVLSPVVPNSTSEIKNNESAELAKPGAVLTQANPGEVVPSSNDSTFAEANTLTDGDRLDSGGSSSLTNILSKISVDTLNSQEMEFYLKEFNDLMRDLDNPASTIIDYLASGLDEESLYVAQFMIAMSGNGLLADSIVDELALANETDYETWMLVMGVADIDTKYSREQLFTVLPSITDPNLISISLNAITPSLVPSEERAQFANDIALYAAHPDEKIRSAAIESIGIWAVHEHAQIISQELHSGTEKTKHSAILATKYIQDDAIKAGLIGIINNTQESFDMHINAFTALSAFHLEPHENDQLYRFYEEHVKPLEMQQN